MTTFQRTALLLIVLWLGLVVLGFRRSLALLVGGLVAVGLFTLTALTRGDVTLNQLGLGVPNSWWPTLGVALAWLALMLAYSPLANWLATRLVDKPPTLQAFRAIQQSRSNLVAAIVIAWVLGGILEEVTFRAIVLNAVEAGLTAWLPALFASVIAVGAAALGAGLLHLYQGPRAVVIITQLAVLFGVLYVISGHNLWAVMLCHGLYDTIAFIRFATKKSKYSDLDANKALLSETQA